MFRACAGVMPGVGVVGGRHTGSSRSPRPNAAATASRDDTVLSSPASSR